MKRNNLENRSTQKIIIFTEDEKSARYYIQDFVRQKSYPARRIVIVQPDNHMPWGLLEAARNAVKTKFVFDAKRTRHLIQKDDIFWLVFDADQHPRIPDTFTAARSGKIQVGIAYSAICFEVWLMMHFHNRITAFPNFDALRKVSAFRDYFPDYDKGDSHVFYKAHSVVDGINGSLDTAKRNAVSLRKKCRDGNRGNIPIYNLNPYCNLYLLFDAINIFFSKAKLSEKQSEIQNLIEDSFRI